MNQFAYFSDSDDDGEWDENGRDCFDVPAAEK